MITNEKLKEIAELANLFIADDNIGGMSAELNEYIEYLSAIFEIKEEEISDLSAVSLDSLREDERFPSLPVDDITGNAKHKESGFFAVEVKKLG